VSVTVAIPVIYLIVAVILPFAIIMVCAIALRRRIARRRLAKTLERAVKGAIAPSLFDRIRRRNRPRPGT
jgi:chromate transport protein ChrA